jgi:uncharacterized protein
MFDGSKREISYPSQFGIFLGLIGAGLLLSIAVFALTWKLMVGGPTPTTTSEFLKPEYYEVNMVIQGLSTFFIFFLPTVVFAAICYRQPTRFLGYTHEFNYRQVLLMIAILLVSIPVCGAVAELNKMIPLPASWEATFKSMEVDRLAQEEAFIKIDSARKYVISLLMIALLPAVFEETAFRGGLQNLLVRWFGSPWPAIILTSILFSLIHASYYGFLVRFSLGVILGLLFHYSRNLWIPILFHFIFNGMQVTALYLMNVTSVAKRKDIEESFPVWVGLIALVALVYLIIAYRKASQEVRLKHALTPGDATPNENGRIL